MKKKINIPFVISFAIFISAVFGMISYLYKVRIEINGLGDLKSLIREESMTEQEENHDDSLRYYLIDGVAVQEKFKDIYLRNKDFYGWVTIDDTSVDYPVMLTPDDEEYYLHRSFDGDYSFSGCIFASSGTRPDSDNTILYGHNMQGSDMFGSIIDYEDTGFYKEHEMIRFDTIESTGLYEVISVFRTQIHDEGYTGFEYWKHINMTEDEFNGYVSNVRLLSVQDTDKSASYGDKLLTLSTCAYHTINGRFVVLAKKIFGKEIDKEKAPIGVIGTK